MNHTTAPVAHLSGMINAVGYRKGTAYHYPNSDNGEDKASSLECLVADQGYESKQGWCSTIREYDVQGETLVFNARMGDTGRNAWWIQT